MDHFFTTFRKLEHELAEPRTQFMQSLLLEFENDIASGTNESYDLLTKEQVDQLIWKNVQDSEEMYKHREDVFCESQVKKLEEAKAKSSLLNNTEDKLDDGYVAGSGLGEISDSENEDSFMENVEEELYYHQKKKENKRIRKKNAHRFGYLAHRIERRVPEIFNGRQFIRQAENILQQLGGDALEALNRAREVYYNPKRVTSDENIQTAVNFAKGENAKDAQAFEDQMYGQSQDF